MPDFHDIQKKFKPAKRSLNLEIYTNSLKHDDHICDVEVDCDVVNQVFFCRCHECFHVS